MLIPFVFTDNPHFGCSVERLDWKQLTPSDTVDVWNQLPGSISIENLELNSPFKNGEKFIFGITPLSPQQFIKQIQN